MYYLAISDEQLRHIAEVNAMQIPHPTVAEAIGMAQFLMGAFRAVEFQDAKVFSGILCELFRAYPFKHGKAVLSPVDGLPSRLKFAPSIAEVREALHAMSDHRQKLVDRCTSEIRKRAKEREERDRYTAIEAARPKNNGASE
jgi:hypothetical protein